jgi:FKBP-type peptidyl-prolyl cis-trans isomerase FklB
MNPKWLAIAIMFFSALAVMAQDKPTTTPREPEPASMTEIEKLSYGIGAQLGKNYLRYKKDLEIDFDIQMFIKGLKDAYTEVPITVSDEELKKIYSNFQKNLQEKAENKLKELGIKNKKEGDAFLLKHKEEKDVYVIANEKGIVQYKIIEKGSGAIPIETDTVTVNYTGKLIDGTVFDNKAEQTIAIPLSKLNNLGLKIALLKMPKDSKWEVVIPPELAYGEKGNGPIQPNATLIFEIKLTGIEHATEPNPTPAPTQNK